MTTTTRPDRRISHETNCALAAMTLNNTHPDDIPALNGALRKISSLHHGSRAVQRTNELTTRELHRRFVDRHCAAMQARVETIALETTEPEAATICHHIERAIAKVGYR